MFCLLDTLGQASDRQTVESKDGGFKQSMSKKDKHLTIDVQKKT